MNRLTLYCQLPESDIYGKGGSLTYIACGVRRSVASVALHAGSHGAAAAAAGGAAVDDGGVAEGTD